MQSKRGVPPTLYFDVFDAGIGPFTNL